MAIQNSFVNVANNRLTRNFGGTVSGSAEPYLSGYHFIYMSKLPKELEKYTPFTQGEMQNLLAGACTSVTPPGGTISKVEFTGLGGTKWAVPGNVDYGNSVSVKFIEFSGTPILDIFHGWVKMIRDYRTGTTNLTGSPTYSKSSYAGVMYYWTTLPDAKTVEQAVAFDGIWPTKDPQDSYGSDVETVGKVDIEIEFNVDYTWREKWVKDKCQTLANQVFGLKESVIEKYGNTLASAS